MTKINGVEHIEIDYLSGSAWSGYRLQKLVGAACDTALTKRGLPIGRWRPAPFGKKKTQKP